MQFNPALLSLIFFLVVGWFCTRSPSKLAQMMISRVGNTIQIGERNKSQEFVEHLREHPSDWYLHYPGLFKLIRFTGLLAYGMFVVGVLIAVLTMAK